MVTLNTILKELKDVPASRLEELYQFVHSLTPDNTGKEGKRKKILSFGGAFSDMSNKDFADLKAHTKKARTKLFNRTVKL